MEEILRLFYSMLMKKLCGIIVILLVSTSCKGPELINRYHRKIQDCIELRIANKNDAYGLKSYRVDEGGFKRTLREFEEVLVVSAVLESKNKDGYKKLIRNIEKVYFDKNLQSQKLNHIQESLGMFTNLYTQTCPAVVLDESLNHNRIIQFKDVLDRLPMEYELGIPDKQYLEDFIVFVNFDNDESRLFYMYLIFLNLKYSSV